MRRGRLLILLGIILAVAAAVLVYILLRQASTGDRPTAVGKRSVVVATQFIEAGTPLDTEGLLETRQVSEDALPPDPVEDIDLTQGMLAGSPIYAGSILQTNMLLTPAQFAEQSVAAQLLEVGFEAVAFPINPLASVAYGIRPNDHVDVLISVFFRDVEEDTQLEEPVCETCTTAEGEQSVVGQQIPRLATQLILQDVRVLGLGVWDFEQPPTQETEDGEPIQPPPQYVTLEVTAQDALVLKYAREVGAIVEFALRPTDDHQTYTTEAITLDYLLTRFSIPVPAKRTYTLLNRTDIEERGYR